MAESSFHKLLPDPKTQGLHPCWPRSRQRDSKTHDGVCPGLLLHVSICQHDTRLVLMLRFASFRALSHVICIKTASDKHHSTLISCGSLHLQALALRSNSIGPLTEAKGRNRRITQPLFVHKRRITYVIDLLVVSRLSRFVCLSDTLHRQSNNSLPRRRPVHSCARRSHNPFV